MQLIWWIVIVGGVIVLARLSAADSQSRRERSREAAIQRKLQAFEHGQRARQTAVAGRSAYELNMLAFHTYQAMLRAAIEADCRASSTSAKGRRC